MRDTVTLPSSPGIGLLLITMLGCSTGQQTQGASAANRGAAGTGPGTSANGISGSSMSTSVPAGTGAGGTTAANAGHDGGLAGMGVVAGSGGIGSTHDSAGTGGKAGSTNNGGSGGTGRVPDAARVDNPYANATGYVNPEWQTKAKAEPGGDRIANTPTAVWLDRIAAIAGTPNSMSNGPMGLRDHLDGALAQHADYIQIVIYDLPGRDCSALASNGELGPDDLPRYKSEYIDKIVAILSEAKYRALRIISIIEPDSLPNLVTNTSVALCAQMKQNGGYVQGVAYALSKLGTLPNTYNYLDAGHHGWLGWDTNIGPTADLFVQTAMMAGMTTVQGFITNTANYSALTEPFFTAATMVGGTSVRQSKWVDWNQYVDELSYAQALRQKLISGGFDSTIGMLIDTSRNGWGGAARPTAASSSTNVDTFVNDSRIDRRIHAGNWCNQSGAGLGERPKPNPAEGIDAYVWIKPPGESDGASMQIANTDGKGFDRMCDPTYTGNQRNGNSMTGALANAPLAGAWFSAQFKQLMDNAYPPL